MFHRSPRKSKPAPKRRNAGHRELRDQNELPEVRVLAYAAHYALAYAKILRDHGALNASKMVERAANAAYSAEDPDNWEHLRNTLQMTMATVRGHAGLSELCETLIFQISEEALGEDPGELTHA